LHFLWEEREEEGEKKAYRQPTPQVLMTRASPDERQHDNVFNATTDG